MTTITMTTQDGEQIEVTLEHVAYISGVQQGNYIQSNAVKNGVKGKEYRLTTESGMIVRNHMERMYVEYMHGLALIDNAEFDIEAGIWAA